MLISVSNGIGVFTMFFLGSVMTWRNAVLVAIAFPLFNLIALLFVIQCPTNFFCSISLTQIFVL